MKLTLFDLSAIFRQFWHASENDEVSTAQNRTLAYVTQNAGADLVAICIDSPPYKRKAIDPEYKAHREKAPEVMHEQLRQTIAALDADGRHVLGAEGYEADDIIATVCAHGTLSEVTEIVIHTSDKDLMQLVDPKGRVKCKSTRTGELFGTEEVKAKFGILPHQISDWLAIVGDTSDNIAGIKGAGPKTATAWLQKFGDLGGIMASVASIEPERFRAVLGASRDQLMKSWKLAQLMTDAPIDVQQILKPKERKTMPQQDMGDELADEQPPPPTEAPPPPAQQPAPAPPIATAPQVQPAAPRPQQTQALVPAPSWEKALEPQSPGQAWGMAKTLFQTRMFGEYPSAEAMLAVIMTGRTMGLDTVQSLRSFHFIQGRASPHSHLLVGLVKRHHSCKYFTFVDGDEKSATYETHREGDAKPTRLTYTFEQATAAGLGKNDQWNKRRAEMLRKTCASQLARIVYPDVTMGLYTAEELE